MSLIKDDLIRLGIIHDNFFSETELVKKDLVNKAVKILQSKNFAEEGFLDPPKGESFKNWQKCYCRSFSNAPWMYHWR